ncbi:MULTISPECIES: hypothetical protein [Vibrio]|uniref:hypothetical protein n=1 Tax=Vibrio TaxID=662 RepID=UPI001BD5C0A0|nr:MULTISPECIES: hypothetical protein [Vibrio]MBS9836178.1 hypothetical protein [Vibrio alginolyticus]MBY4650230.1 hypothetical protein [Vibrio alginolyticus]MDW1907203.1 hypothetical protein [Vibrio sp. 705]
MKLKIFLATTYCLILSACGNSSTPLDVGKNFLDEFCSFDAEGAKKYSSKAFGSVIITKINNIVSSEQQKADPILKCEYEITEVREQPNRATLQYSINYIYQSGASTGFKKGWANVVMLEYSEKNGWQVNDFN